jgi:leader peptidase (prepilin peptidase) / N-methyltransferase
MSAVASMRSVASVRFLGAPAVLAAAVGALAAIARFGFTSAALVTACFLAALGVLAVIDLQRGIVPDRIVLPAAGLVLALQLALFPDHSLEWVLSAVGCAGVLFALTLLKPGGLGMGDVKLGLLLGAGLGLEAAPALLIGCLALWPVAVWIVLRGDADARTQTLPLVPAVAFGALVVVLAG